MKIIITLSLITLLLISCKKDYTCVCESTVIFPAYTNVNNVYFPQDIRHETIVNTITTKKKNAVSDCEKFETNSTVNYQSAEGQGEIISTKNCGLK